MMQRFFFDNEKILNDRFSVNGEKFNHISRVLRMSPGEKAIFCDGAFNDYVCRLISLNSENADFEILDKYRNKTEPCLRITVFQCLPKGEKIDEMVKRCVQFGVHKIVPVLSRRCVARPDGKSAAKKIERLNKISRSSAMQSMRGCIPEITDLVDIKEAILMMKRFDTSFVCYEEENDKLPLIPPEGKGELAFLIGPEGGLDEAEIEFATQNGIPCVTLGKRILRTEDAAAFLLPILLFNTGNL